ncbi:hypothetical protein L6164_007006 [Bauhinia variegata]|uniref:Uncharacterized protein n=1 Tax=Bauhinia variegata TaxID=167791 RepID=A0ACB9PYY8_BAUVA|nr:hypothetical protein L6164_007006 [Bauhinia variegata]
MSGDGDRQKKKIAAISIYSLLLVAMAVAVTVGITNDLREQEEYSGAGEEEDHNDSNKAHVPSSLKQVISLCESTDYQEECVDSMKEEAGNVTSPRELIKIAFSVTIEKIHDGLKESQLLREVEKEPRAKMALDSCKELLENSIDDLRHSIERVGGEFDAKNSHELLMDLKVWLSSTITNQETCLDGFQNTTSEAAEKMKEALKLAMHLSSNGLDIIDHSATSLTTINITPTANDHEEGATANHQEGHRRLLQVNDLGRDQILSWIGGGLRRRLLSEETLELDKGKADAVVAKDGSGKFKSINEALKNMPINSNKPFVIYVKEGIYNEYVNIEKNMTHVVMVGDGGEKTRITGNKNFIDGVNTFKTATVAVEGDNFMAMNIGFENSAGPEKHQAVALRVGADMAVFYNCSMDGYQDTLYIHTKRQFYRDCTISGTIDFVFGDSLTVFQNCTFKVRKPMENQQCIVTAQGRKDKHEPTAIIIQGGSIMPDPSFDPVKLKNKVYLARPWKPYSRTIIMDAFISDLITPEGYLPWQNNHTWIDTCFYTEYNNSGPGSNKSDRVKWPGIKAVTAEEALDFTPSKFYKGDAWIKHSGVPYSPETMPSNSKSNPDSVSDPKSKPESDSGSISLPDSNPDFGSIPKLDSPDKSKSKPNKSKPKSKSDTDNPKSKPKSEFDSDSKPNSHRKSKHHSNSDPKSHSKSDSDSKSKPKSHGKPKSHHKSNSKSPKPKRDSNSSFKPK